MPYCQKHDVHYTFLCVRCATEAIQRDRQALERHLDLPEKEGGA